MNKYVIKQIQYMSTDGRISMGVLIFNFTSCLKNLYLKIVVVIILIISLVTKYINKYIYCYPTDLVFKVFWKLYCHINNFFCDSSISYYALKTFLQERLHRALPIKETWHKTLRISSTRLSWKNRYKAILFHEAIWKVKSFQLIVDKKKNIQKWNLWHAT